MYLSKFQNVFVLIAKYICHNCKMHLSKLQNVFVWIANCICPNCKMYLSKLHNVFVQIAKCICQNCKMNLHELWVVKCGGQSLCLIGVWGRNSMNLWCHTVPHCGSHSHTLSSSFCRSISAITYDDDDHHDDNPQS